MSQPGPEARIANLEKEAMSLGARIEEAAAGTAESLREMHYKKHFMKQDVKQLDVNTMTSFKHIAETFVTTWDDTKATLATKEDLTGLEGRVKDDISATQGYSRRAWPDAQRASLKAAEVTRVREVNALYDGRGSHYLGKMRLKPIHPQMHFKNGGSNAFTVVPKGTNTCCAPFGGALYG
ncbi:MAG TPA: hypothetical protein VN207_09630 [Ktedonobacteraceae bacterium]|nr:hypothetical protein [Ktedonobacteraceae bacterium]